MRSKTILSRTNAHFKELKKLVNSIGFDSDVIVVEGDKLIKEALDLNLKPLSTWTTPTKPLTLGAHHFQIPENLYRAISPTRSGNAPLVLFECPKIDAAIPSNLHCHYYLLLDQIQDPGNAGALIRAAAAFGFEAVLWHQPCVYPFHHACIRASAGALFRLQHLLIGSNFWQTFHGIDLIASDLQGTLLDQFSWPSKMILAMGNEGHGFSEAVRNHVDHRVLIPISPNVESLNVAGAAHIIMHEIQRQKK